MSERHYMTGFGNEVATEEGVGEVGLEPLQTPAERSEPGNVQGGV